MRVVEGGGWGDPVDILKRVMDMKIVILLCFPGCPELALDP